MILISVENLLSAWRDFYEASGKRKDVAAFSLDFMPNILMLHRDLGE